MQVKYFPSKNNDWSQIPGQTVAVAVLLPDAYPGTTGKQWPWELLVHGIGERSGGILANLTNLVEGVDYNGDGIPDASFIKSFHKEVIDKYGIVLVVPTYEGFFDSNKVNWVYDFVRSKFSLVEKMAFGGFSYGGGAAVAYAKSSLANVKRMAVCFPCAPTNAGGVATYVGQANLPMHLFVNDEDDNAPTNIDVTKAIVTEFNKINPGIKVQYTAFRQKYHGGFDKATDIVVPTAPGGQGVINLSENVHEWYLDVLKNGPRPMKTATSVPPTPAPEPTPVDPIAEFNLTEGMVITTPTFQADGSASKNVKTDWEGYLWGVKPVQGGSWSARPEVGAYGGPLKKLIDLKDGKYEMSLQVMSPDRKTNTKKVTVTVKLGATVKTPVSFDSATDELTYSDGSTEKATATFADGNWTVKNQAGQTINL